MVVIHQEDEVTVGPVHHPGNLFRTCGTNWYRGTTVNSPNLSEYCHTHMRNYLLVEMILSKNKFKRFTRNVIVYWNLFRTFV